VVAVAASVLGVAEEALPLQVPALPPRAAGEAGLYDLVAVRAEAPHPGAASR
jgi:hypothetical protein